MNTSELIAQILLKEKAVFLRPEEPFTWTSGIKSPVYCDNRLLISSVESREAIIEAFVDAIKSSNVDVIAGRRSVDTLLDGLQRRCRGTRIVVITAIRCHPNLVVIHGDVDSEGSGTHVTVGYRNGIGTGMVDIRIRDRPHQITAIRIRKFIRCIGRPLVAL